MVHALPLANHVRPSPVVNAGPRDPAGPFTAGEPRFLFAGGTQLTAGEQVRAFASGRWPRSVRPGPRLPLAKRAHSSPVIRHVLLTNQFYSSPAVLTLGEHVLFVRQ